MQPVGIPLEVIKRHQGLITLIFELEPALRDDYLGALWAGVDTAGSKIDRDDLGWITCGVKFTQFLTESVQTRH